MSAIMAILSRLGAGRPVILTADPGVLLGNGGAAGSGPVPLGLLVRTAPDAVAEHYDNEIAAGADVLVALTAQTSTRALSRIGMGYRAAALTGTAVELACDAVDRAVRPVAVAGMLGARGIGPMPADRIGEEYAVHAARLAAASCELIVARGFDVSDEEGPGFARLTRRAAVAAASATGLPTWARLEVLPGGTTEDGEPIEDAVASVVEGGASAVVLDAPDVRTAELALERVASAVSGATIGILLADEREPDGAGAPALEAWGDDVKRLVDAGARLVGGGAGTTPLHTAVIAKALGRSDRTSIWPRAV